jgi:hypothetical protein
MQRLTFRRRGAVLTALALAMVLAATVLPSVARAHDGEFHATAVAEGGDTLKMWDPPGIEPTREIWLDAMASIKHTVKADGDYYQPSFKVNSWQGVFSEDDSIYAAPGDPMPVDYSIRVGLLLYDTTTHVTTRLSSYDGFFTSGNGWSYGCQGDGREIKVTPQFGKMLVADLWVNGIRKYYENGSWRNVLVGQGYHTTRSYRMDTAWWYTEPPSMGHTFESDPMTGHFIRNYGSLPGTVISGYCPLWTTVE